MKHISSFFVICILFIGFGGVAFSSDSIGAGTTADPAFYFGPSSFLGNGAFRAFCSIDHEKERPVSVGTEWSKSLFIDPPPTGMYELELTVPDILSVYTPFQAITTSWTPSGHPGTAYWNPHMDWHFYFTNLEEREADIPAGTCGEGVSATAFCRSLRPVPAPCCPPAYIVPQIVVPAMGNHLVDVLDSAVTEGKFVNALLIGAFDGRPTFYEPMITIDHITKVFNGTIKEDCRPIRNPAKHAVEGYYPTAYCIYSTTNNLRLEMTNFTYIPGGCGTVEEFGFASCGYNPAMDAGITMNDVINCNDCPYYKYTKDMAIDRKKK